jgi:hypothetical protein
MEYFNVFTAWHQVPSPVERWLSLTSFGYKINFDTTENTFSVQVAVCCNHWSHIVSMISQISSHYLPNYDEALAALLAIFLVTSLKLEKFIH